MSTVTIRRWKATAGSTRAGIEVLGAQVAPGQLDSLRKVCVTLNAKECAFLLVRLAPTDAAGVKAGLLSAAQLDAPARICLSIESSTLACLGAERLDTSRTGLLLDDIDASTPPAALLHESLEAVRFRGEFIEQADSSLRVGFALEAMLGLARSLGLAALGQETTARGQCHSEPRFDYTTSHRKVGRIAGAMPLHYQGAKANQPSVSFRR